jgi:phosphonate transport system substrate-binding protein
MKRRSFTAALSLALGPLPTLSAPPKDEPRAMTVAVVPQFRAEEIHRIWAPLLARVGQETGQPLTLLVPSNIPAFERAMLAGEPDFVYANPYHAVMGHRAQGYIPLVRDSTLLTGIVVVRADDPIRSVAELDGKTVAFPAPNAFGASLWIRALLAEREKIRIQPAYVKTHSNAYRSVLAGLSAAAGGINLTFDQEPPEVRKALRVLMETPGVPPHPLAAHPRVSAATRRAITETFMRLMTDRGMRELMNDIPWVNPVAADYAHDYQPLESFGLDKYVVNSATP